MNTVKNVIGWIVLGLILYAMFYNKSTSSARYSTYSDDGDYFEENNCSYKDGMHDATVDYYNPETEYSAEYSLEVEVDDCHVVKIEFPKGGWLDEDHIDAELLDEKGHASIIDDKGREWEIQLEEPVEEFENDYE